jgi:hypothetical protein
MVGNELGLYELILYALPHAPHSLPQINASKDVIRCKTLF